MDYEGCAFRFTHSFGPIEKARQAVIKQMLKARGGTFAEQTLLNGGRNLAINKIRRHARGGFIFIAKVDISSCYNSFVDTEFVAKTLCIPKQVVRSTMMAQSLDLSRLHIHRETVKDSHLSFNTSDLGQRLTDQFQKNRSSNPLEVFIGLFGDDWINAQQGLIQGAKCSGRAAEILLKPICEACCQSSNWRVVNFADDFFLMAKSLKELLRLIKTLELACNRHPAGALKVTKKIIGRNEPFEFLGYHFEPIPRKCFRMSWGQKSAKKSSIRP